jgi:hypothetical protein
MSDKMREAFEKWAGEYLHYPLDKTINGPYVTHSTAIAWHAWQAAHAAALPPTRIRPVGAWCAGR